MSTNNSMVGHKWAHGQAAQGSNMRSDGKALYSFYTTVGYNTGKGLVFLPSDRMSSRTGRHLNLAWRGASHLDRIYTPLFCYGRRIGAFDENEAFRLACKALNETLEGFSTARLSKYLHSRITYAMKKREFLDDMAAKYGFEFYEFATVPAEKIVRAEIYGREAEEKERVKYERRHEQYLKDQIRRRELDAGQFNAWRAGESVSCPYSHRYDANGGYYTTVRGDKVITSGGAECPVDHARRGILFWASRIVPDTGPARVFTPWQKNGHSVPLGHFQLDRIDEQGTAYAGCHKFTADELNTLYHKLV